MSPLRRLRLFFFPKPWTGCSPPAFAEERLAHYERRRGRHLAQLRPTNEAIELAAAELRALSHLRARRVRCDFDARATVVRKLDPMRLP